MHKKNTFWSKKGCFIALIALLTLLSEPLNAQQRSTHNASVAKNLELFNEIYRMLDLFYVDTLSADTVMQWAIEGMLRRIDPFTEYYPEESDDLRQMATGKYAGIGAIIRYVKSLDRTVIAEPYRDTPSSRAGLKAGDIIISVDGKDTKGMDTQTVSQMLRGEAGTTFTLVYKRPDEDAEHEVLVTRETIQLPAIPYYGVLGDGVGYLYLSSFTEGCARAMRMALLEMKNQGATRLLLDLRGNPGGALTEAVDVVNIFVGKGEKVVYTKGKISPANQEYLTTSDPVDTEMPVVVMVNGGTASSAEIVSGSLQDLDRAVIVGTRTYGKGLVQMVRSLNSGGTVKVTTSRYYIPSGRCIQAHDYKHDGTESIVPDSLQKTFHTRDGREVKDGGGILPDILVKKDSVGRSYWQVEASDAFFNWCTRYVKTHPEAVPVEQFALTEADFSDFTAYATEADSTLNADTLMKYRERLTFDLEQELATRYYWNDGAVHYGALHDPHLQDARRLLLDDERMKKILKPEPIKENRK
ncbi:MAG: S41 family peptidase [Bacteroidaceae bacterium]|jgi:carboxyl-terminal processing protease|nr:S41 family peptidase [Bacteroidaceae bacterium]